MAVRLVMTLYANEGEIKRLTSEYDANDHKDV